MSKRGRSSGRDENDGGSKRQRRTTTTLPSSTLKRLDPLILARGSTPRWVGARTKLAILTPEEIDRDLRHMEAYANACTAYAQQYFIYSNRNLVQSGHYGATTTSRKEHNLVMPVRIDPEEEKRISQLRARIAASEKLREVLETEYVSLRAAYVYESHFLSKTRNNVDSQLTFLQSLIRQRGHVVALQRVRCAMARDVLSCLTARTFGIENDNNDMLQVWNAAEMQLKEAERNLKQQESGDVMLWNARTLPRTPNDLPLYLSQLSCAPDKGAGFGCGGIFGSKKSSMCWIQRNLPLLCSSLETEKAHVKHLQNSVGFLTDELQTERHANTMLQSQIATRRKKNDEIAACLSLIRSETEAVLHRHNILLDTPEARAVAQELHLQSIVDEGNNNNNNNNNAPLVEEEEEEEDDLDHDGDDEGDDEEEEMFEV